MKYIKVSNIDYLTWKIGAIVLLFLCLLMIFLHNSEQKDISLCDHVNYLNWSNIQGYNGTSLGGYSCYLDKNENVVDIYFNPIGENNCIGCNPENYHFMCIVYKDKNNCFLVEKFMRVAGGLYD